MRKSILYLGISLTILASTKVFAYSNECVTEVVYSNQYKVKCYDTDGNQISEKDYRDNAVYKSKTWTYSKNMYGYNDVLYKYYSGDSDGSGTVDGAVFRTFIQNDQLAEKIYYGDPEKGAEVYSGYEYKFTDSSANNVLSYEEWSDGAQTKGEYGTYNEAGKLILAQTYNGNPKDPDTLSRTTVMAYDNEGNMIAQKDYKGDPSQGAAVYNGFEKIYDDEGRQTANFSWYKGILRGWESAYNDDGNQTLYKEYKEGAVTSTLIHAYDNNGKEILSKQYNGDPDDGAQVYSGYEKVYNSEGKQIASWSWNEGSLNGWEYIYGENGKIQSYKNYANDVVTGGWANFWNDDGSIATKYYSGDLENGGRVTQTELYLLDNDNRLISQQYYFGDPDNGGTLYAANVITHDEYGNEIWNEYYFEDGKIYKLDYENNPMDPDYIEISEAEWQTVLSYINQSKSSTQESSQDTTQMASNKKRIYTVEEATAAVSKGGKNKFSITYR